MKKTATVAIAALSIAIPATFFAARSGADDGPTCYAIAYITIHDRDEYGKYEAGFGEIFQKYGGTILAGSEDPEVLEGEWNYTRVVLLSFPSKKALETWYNSDEYQRIVKHRFSASDANIILLEAR